MEIKTYEILVKENDTTSVSQIVNISKIDVVSISKEERKEMINFIALSKLKPLIIWR